MKKYLNIKTILLIISILIIILGVITVSFKGFEKSIEYKAGTRIEVNIPNGYEKQNIINIAKESFDTDEILFSKIEKLNQIAGIKVAEYSEEQLNAYLNKISEEYKIEQKDIKYYEIEIPETKISTIVEPYLLPVLLITTLSLAYIIIKNYKAKNKIKISLEILGILVIILSLFFSLIAIFRLQFNIYTMPLALAIYIVTLLIAVNKKCE